MDAQPATKKPRTSTSAVPAPTGDLGASLLPISRVNRIIKADKDVRLCSKEAIFLIAKATEHMLGKMTSQAHAQARLQKRGKMVKYSDLASVATQPQWFYLGEVIPSSIPLSAALSLRQQNEDVLNAPSTTAVGGEKAYEGKRILKGRKKVGGPGAPGEDGVGKRTTRGKKLSLPAGEGGPDEDDDDDDDDEGSRAPSEAAGLTSGAAMDVDG
ncbi:hypothetical protein JCM1840_007263 [Sporobolomyces johnsonii]